MRAERADGGSIAPGRPRRRAGTGSSSVTFLCGFVLLTGACARMHARDVQGHSLPPLAVPMTAGTAPGSLWRPDRAANYPLVDVRPRFPGDLLTVVISEETKGSKDAGTELKTDSSVAASVKEFFGIPNVGRINPANAVEAASKRSFDGQGKTDRKASLTGRITVTVTAVEPNGNLHVEGQKTVNLNNEDEYVVLRGVVRPEDIDTNNEVPSWRLADARIDFYGSGVVANQQRPGVLYTLLDWLWPF